MTQTTTAPAPQAAPPTDRLPVTQLMWQGGTLIALLALIAFFGIMRPDAFFSFGNIRNILLQISILAIIAAAQTVVMVVGDFDLSVGSNASLSGATAAALMINEVPIPLAVIAGLAVGLIIGIVNGMLVAYLGISAIIATLATMTTFGGLAFIVTSGTTLYGMPEQFHVIGQGRPGGIPMPVIFAVVISLVIWVLLRFTTLGRRWYAVGGNLEVARLSGVSVKWARLLAFAVCGLVSAMGGIILVSRLGAASSSSGSGYMMLAVAAAFLGMTMLQSGQANVGGTLVGVGIIGVLSNGLNILGVNTYVQEVLTGIIIIGAVALSVLKKRHD